MSHHQDLNLAVTCVFASVLPIDLRLSHGLFICLENPTQALILYGVMKDWSMKLTKVFGSFMASASPLFHPETWQKYLARHIDLLHSSQSLSCVTASVPCCAFLPKLQSCQICSISCYWESLARLPRLVLTSQKFDLFWSLEKAWGTLHQKTRAQTQPSKVFRKSLVRLYLHRLNPMSKFPPHNRLVRW